MPQFKRSLHIFRRDLRLEDNAALLAALERSRDVLPAFIIDPRQREDHPYRSLNALQFMRRSLEELSRELGQRSARLYVFSGAAEDAVAELLEKAEIDAVFLNKDHTLFSHKRDLAIKKVCQARNVPFEVFDDALLCAPGAVMKDAGGPYTVFSAFLKKALTVPVAKPRENRFCNYFTGPLKLRSLRKDLSTLFDEDNPDLAVTGGRHEALTVLGRLESFRDYGRTRDIPSLKGTTRLSAHNKFGTVSVREVYHAVRNVLGEGHLLIRELYWRDFFTHIAHHFPHVFGSSFYDEYEAIPWQNDQMLLKAWQEGKTGFPIVDAGMRELNATGFMHNRVRMITASFLVKDLHVDWRLGERYFATRLVDYDPAVNNGNWQWAASTGCDHQPYFRIFNPWLQQKRFDPRALYIKTWVPELKTLAPEAIHSVGGAGGIVSAYPAPVISHTDAARWSRDTFRAASRRAKIF